MFVYTFAPEYSLCGATGSQIIGGELRSQGSGSGAKHRPEAARCGSAEAGAFLVVDDETVAEALAQDNRRRSLL